LGEGTEQMQEEQGVRFRPYPMKVSAHDSSPHPPGRGALLCRSLESLRDLIALWRLLFDCRHDSAIITKNAILILMYIQCPYIVGISAFECCGRRKTVTEKRAGYWRLTRWVLRLIPPPRSPSFFRMLSLWRHTVFSEMPESSAIWAVDLPSLTRAAVRISVEVRLAY